MKTHLSKVLVAGLTMVVAQACASPEKRPVAPNASGPSSESAGQEAGNAAVLGQEQSEAGTAQIARKKQVIVTEKTSIPTLRTSSTRADLNRVQADHLVALGASQDVARNIVNYRNEHGQFKSIDELHQVDGMNEDLFKTLSGKLGVSSPTG